MGKLVASKDWSQTPLGPIETWPQSLRTTVSLCLASNFPISIAWGPQRIQIYNDGYWPICGAKHPHSMGQDFKECWLSAWPAIGAAFERASAGESAFLENQRMFLDRHGYLEETFFTFSFSPIRDASGEIAGLFHPVNEMTQQLLGDRRMKILRELSDETSDAETVTEACRLIAETLSRHELDVPFSLLYLIDSEGERATLAGSSGIAPGTGASPESVRLNAQESPWPLARATRDPGPLRVDALGSWLAPLGCGPYPEPPHTALVLPINLSAVSHTFALLVAGVSSRRELDGQYRTFYLMLCEAVSNALTNARAYEEERKRAEALAELDRAKTAFFSNVSHEFRTPLTLMLGPLEDTLREAAELQPGNRGRLEVAHRNSVRLLKLVNALLDFSRLEAGRINASYEATDLAVLTAELCTMFRTVIERAGLEFVVDCAPIGEPAYVDHQMWEKIVFNLLSNAFKFTLEGRIEANLRRIGNQVAFVVRDTGTGIPADELPSIFQRFHRVQGAHGRTLEGSGIGLALVQELARLHQGNVQVDSDVGVGSTFTVTIPLGRAHLPAERISPARADAASRPHPDQHVQEAWQWLTREQAEGDDFEMRRVAGTTQASGQTRRARILLADDSKDMREYIRRLLEQSYEVEAVADGEAALRAARSVLPDLVVTDVMVPGLDGFGLLRELRADRRTATIPVIMVSARAGEESRVDGMAAGADDYLIKPFSARELLARIGARLEIARVQRQARAEAMEIEERRRLAMNAAGMGSWDWNRLTGDIRWSFTTRKLFGVGPDTPITFAVFESLVHPAHRASSRRAIKRSLATGDYEDEYRIVRPDGAVRWIAARGRVMRDERGRATRMMGVVHDCTERQLAEQRVREYQAHLRLTTEAAQVGTWQWDVESDALTWSPLHNAMWGYDAAAGAVLYEDWSSRVNEDDLEVVERAIDACLGGTGTYDVEYRIVPRHSNETRWIRSTGRAVYDAAGKAVAMRGVSFDVTERRTAEQALRESERQLSTLISNLPGMAYRCLNDRDWTVVFMSAGAVGITGYDAQEFTSGRMQWADLEHQDDIALVWEAVQNGIRERRPYQMEYRIRHRDGTVRWVWEQGEGVFNGDGHLVALEGFVADITQRRMMEEALREADRRKDDFLAMLGHELRNPLAAISSGVAILHMDPPADRREWAEQMVARQARQLQRLVDDLLDVTRITRGKIRLHKKALDVRTVVEAAVESVGGLFDDRGHDLIVTVPEHPLMVLADAARLEQVIVNLLTNAAKYTPEGGRVVLVAEVSGTEAVISCADTGIGIAADMLDAVFESFVQIDPGLDRTASGLGMGLTLVKRLTEMHGGTVSAASAGKGQGSVFTARLPMLRADSAVQHEATGDDGLEEVAPDALRILVIDDNRDLAESVAVYLRGAGHHVVMAHDGESGIECAERDRPDVILLDLGLPGIDGFDVASRLRRTPTFKDVAIIAISGYKPHDERVREAGFDTHLVKPVSYGRLMRTLRETLAARR